MGKDCLASQKDSNVHAGFISFKIYDSSPNWIHWIQWQSPRSFEGTKDPPDWQQKPAINKSHELNLVELLDLQVAFVAVTLVVVRKANLDRAIFARAEKYLFQDFGG